MIWYPYNEFVAHQTATSPLSEVEENTAQFADSPSVDEEGSFLQENLALELSTSNLNLSSSGTPIRSSPKPRTPQTATPQSRRVARTPESKSPKSKREAILKLERILQYSGGQAAFADNSTTVIASGNTLVFQSILAETQVQENVQQFAHAHTRPITTFAVSRSTRLLVSVHQGPRPTLCLFDLSTRSCIAVTSYWGERFVYHIFTTQSSSFERPQHRPGHILKRRALSRHGWIGFPPSSANYHLECRGADYHKNDWILTCYCRCQANVRLPHQQD